MSSEVKLDSSPWLSRIYFFKYLKNLLSCLPWKFLQLNQALPKIFILNFDSLMFSPELWNGHTIRPFDDQQFRKIWASIFLKENWPTMFFICHMGKWGWRKIIKYNTLWSTKRIYFFNSEINIINLQVDWNNHHVQGLMQITAQFGDDRLQNYWIPIILQKDW